MAPNKANMQSKNCLMASMLSTLRGHVRASALSFVIIERVEAGIVRLIKYMNTITLQSGQNMQLRTMDGVHHNMV